jgi:hypothetical protein
VSAPAVLAEVLAERLAPRPEVTPELLQARQLLQRNDAKFCLPAAELLAVLEACPEDYAVLRAGGRPVATYRTRYFDTPELTSYHDHRRGRRRRCKVRVRHYLDREVSYLEVKLKGARDCTAKTRWRRAFLDGELSPEDRARVAQVAPSHAEALAPVAETWFQRLTLLRLEVCERVTVDLALELFPCARPEALVTLNGVAIVEVKQPRPDRRSPLMCALRARGARTVSMSKYCAAVALCVDRARDNAFLPNLRTIRAMDDAHPLR